MAAPGVIGWPKRAPKGGDRLCGKFVPEGTDVFMNLWGMLRDRKAFGVDADVFRPERWLDLEANGKEGEEKRKEMMRSVDLAWGHGRWACPGKALAWMEVDKVVVEVSWAVPVYSGWLCDTDLCQQLLRNFDFQLMNPEKPWRMQTYTTILIDDFLLRVTEADGAWHVRASRLK
jgi:hypothetical protein